MRIVELVIDEDSDFLGVEAISIVTHPAIESDGVMLEKKKPVLMAKETETKGVFIAPILKPNKLIYREDDLGGYYIHFSKATIQRCAEMYMKELRQWNTTEQHKEDVQDVCLIESWVVEDVNQDKSSIYNLDVNNGTWCGVFRIDNEDVRAKLESGELRGLSIEGFFAENLAKLSGDEFLTKLGRSIKV